MNDSPGTLLVSSSRWRDDNAKNTPSSQGRTQKKESWNRIPKLHLQPIFIPINRYWLSCHRWLDSLLHARGQTETSEVAPTFPHWGWCTEQVPPGRASWHSRQREAKRSIPRRRAAGRDKSQSRGGEGGGRESEGFWVGAEASREEWADGEEAEATAKTACSKTISLSAFPPEKQLPLVSTARKSFSPPFPPLPPSSPRQDVSYLRGKPHATSLKIITKTAHSKCGWGIWFISRWKRRLKKQLKQELSEESGFKGGDGAVEMVRTMCAGFPRTGLVLPVVPASL